MSEVKPAAASLSRRLVAEGLGTALLVTVVVGSGIAAAALSPDDTGLQLLENSTATVFGLAVLILIFGPVSGAHFNPVVSAADWLLGRRTGGGLPGREVLAYAAAQTVGGIAGAVWPTSCSTSRRFRSRRKDRLSVGHGIGEVVATAGLVMLIFALARTGRAALSAAAVGAYIGSAYWFTSSTSFANPAVTIGRMFSDTFAGIAPASAPVFIAAQLVGGCSASGWSATCSPTPRPPPAGPSSLTPAVTTEKRLIARVQAQRVVRLRPQRRPVPDGRRVPHPPVPRSGRGPLGRLRTRRAGQPGRGAGDGRGRASTSPPRSRRSSPTHAVRESDVVITMGCGDTCPFYPGKRYEDWVLEDPAGKGVDSVRPIRDEIRSRVETLIGQLLPAARS